MPANRPYPGEDPAVARKRIAANKAKINPDEVKTKADMMAENVSSTIKNLGGGY